MNTIGKLIASFIILSSGAPFLLAELQHVYFGTSGKGSEGVYHAVFNDKKGRFSEPDLVAEMALPSFLAEHPKLNVIYAIVGKDEHVHSFRKSDDGGLIPLNRAAVGDGRSAHIAVHPSGELLITAQYRGGSVAVFPLGKKGEVLERTQLFKHEGGSKVNHKRQESPHPHWTGFSRDGRFAMIPDLGMDQIVIYSVDVVKKSLTEHGKATVPPGSGPRHMRFSMDGEFIYLLNELSLTISTFKYNTADGTAKLIDTTKTISEELKANQNSNAASEILVHPNGHFVYSANRGHDSVTVYSRDVSTGKLSHVEVESTRGSWPRSMSLSPSGKWLLVGNQFSNNVALFSIDEESGGLTFFGRETFSVPNPSCVLFSRASSKEK